MINREHQFIYIHPPKTGGTSIEKLFDSDADTRDVEHKHKYADFYWRPEWCDFYRFGSVRNPFDRMVSYYFWRLKKKLVMFGRDNFEDWIAFITDFPEYRKYQETNWHFTTAIDNQWNMLRLIDNIVRFEHFQDDFDKVCSEIGIPKMELPHTNKSERGSYQQYYTGRSKELIEKYHWKDLKHYDYKF